MHVQKQSNSRVLNIPFSCRNWMEAKDLCISLYFFSVIMTLFIDHMLIPLLRVLLHLLSVTVVIAAHRNMNKTKGDPDAAFWVGNRVGTTWALILLLLPQQRLEEAVPCSPYPPLPVNLQPWDSTLHCQTRLWWIERWILEMSWRRPNFNTAFRWSQGAFL